MNEYIKNVVNNQRSANSKNGSLTEPTASTSLNGKIVFFEDKNGKQGISTLDTQNNKITQISPNWGFEFSASPDGSKYAYYDKDNSPTNFIFIVDGADGEINKLTPMGTDGWDFSWSPDGSKIAYEFQNMGNGDDKEIYLIDVDGKLVA